MIDSARHFIPLDVSAGTSTAWKPEDERVPLAPLGNQGFRAESKKFPKLHDWVPTLFTTPG